MAETRRLVGLADRSDGLIFTDGEAKDIVNRAKHGQPGRILKKKSSLPACEGYRRYGLPKRSADMVGALARKICHCGNQRAYGRGNGTIRRSHRNPRRAPLKTFLCNDHFREIMGPAAWL